MVDLEASTEDEADDGWRRSRTRRLTLLTDPTDAEFGGVDSPEYPNVVVLPDLAGSWTVDSVESNAHGVATVVIVRPEVTELSGRNNRGRAPKPY